MRSTIIALAAAAALAACSVKDGKDSDATAEVNETADLTPEGPGLATRLFGGGKAMPLDIQQKLANGAIIYLTSIQAKPTETVIGVRIVNGAERDIELNWSDQKTFLVAGGQKFFLSPPVENEDLKVTTGANMEGDLVFLGTLPRAGQITLVMNDGMSDSQYSSTPGISIPVPVDSVAWSDDGSKKNSAV